MKFAFWDLLTILALVMTAGAGAVFAEVFINPNSALNPFPPPTLPPTVAIPSATPTYRSLPATWTPGAAQEDEPALQPSSTPLTLTPYQMVHTFTSTVTETPTHTVTATITLTRTKTPLPSETLTPKPSKTNTPQPTRTRTTTPTPTTTSTSIPNRSLYFQGHASGDIDRVKVPLDDPHRSVDVGAGRFTIEFWLKVDSLDGGGPDVSCGGSDDSWRNGTVLFDRNRPGGRSYGIALTDGGRVAFAVSNDADTHILCGSVNVANGGWHHVAVQRRPTDGYLWIYVDGNIDNNGATSILGDISYPDGAGGGNDPYLVIGKEKYDGGFAGFNGWLDEVRISDRLRYTSNFSPPGAPFSADENTLALYHFNEGSGGTIVDASGRDNNGSLSAGGDPSGPEWSSDTPW